MDRGYWSVRDPGDFRWVYWAGDYSLFHAGTGETHLLNEFPADILRRLSATPLTVKELANAMAEECQVVSDVAWLEKVANTLIQLEALDLIDRLD